MISSYIQNIKSSLKSGEHGERQPLIPHQDTERADDNETENATRTAGPDSWRWWRVIAACHVILFIIGGLGRLFSLIFVELIKRYEVNRELASLPFSVHLASKNLSGPVVGWLGNKIGVRSIIVLGAIISAFSIGACYFVESFIAIVIFWGFLNGIGTSLCTTLLPVVIDQYFRKYKTSAMGLSFFGGCHGAMLFPLVLGNMIHVQGIETYFVASFFIVTVFIIPAGIILQKPPWMRRSAQSTLVSIGQVQPIQSKPYPSIETLHAHKDLAIKLVNNIKPVNEDLEKLDFNLIKPFYRTLNDHIWPELEKLFERFQTFVARSCGTTARSHSFDQAKPIKISKKRSIADDPRLNVQHQSTSDSESLENSNDHYRDLVMLKLKTLTSRKIPDISTACLHENVSDLKKIANEFKKLYHIIKYLDEIEDGALSEQTNTQVASFGEENTNLEKVSTRLQSKLWGNVLYYVLCLSRTVHFFTFISVMTTVVDFVMDRGLEKLEGKYAVLALSVGDAIGRSGTGWLNDFGYLSVQILVMSMMMILSLVTFSLPLMPNTTMIFLGLVIFGILQGSLFVRHSILVYKYTRKHEYSTATGFLNFFSGVIACLMPLYIGYFRDSLGSYDNMFYINSVITALMGTVWAFEPYMQRFLPVEETPADNRYQEAAEAL